LTPQKTLLAVALALAAAFAVLAGVEHRAAAAAQADLEVLRHDITNWLIIEGEYNLDNARRFGLVVETPHRSRYQIEAGK